MQKKSYYGENFTRHENWVVLAYTLQTHTWFSENLTNFEETKHRSRSVCTLSRFLEAFLSTFNYTHPLRMPFSFHSNTHLNFKALDGYAYIY
jgi:hypothetical protein